jgi:hypothetical protein
VSNEKGAGRPCKIDQKMIDEMKQYMIAGLTLKDACSLLEIDTSTWRRFEKKNPKYAVKRKKWQSMLKTQALINIAGQIMKENDAGWSAYLLKREMTLEEKRATNALARAQAKESRARVKNIEADTRIKETKAIVAERLGMEDNEQLEEVLNKLTKEAGKVGTDKSTNEETD